MEDVKLSGFRILAVLAGILASGNAAFVIRPYLENLTDSSVSLLWLSSSSTVGGVEYGLTASYGDRVTESEADTMHQITLPGLLADTVYHYRAYSGTDTSPDRSFHTGAASSQEFSFFVYGDDRTDSASHQSVIDAMAAVSPTPGLMINVGDLTADGTDNEYSTFFHIEREMADHVTLFPTMGNHDYNDVPCWQYYFRALPNNQQWYSVHYGNSAFHVLDVYADFSPGSAQYNWLLSEFLADSANPAIRHIFVICHEPPYTTNTTHPGNTDIQSYICPLLDRFHVGIAYQGHNHCYEHSLVSGVHYVITGGGGAPLYNTWGSPQSWTVYREATYEYTLTVVHGDTVSCKGVRTDGSVMDSFGFVGKTSGISESEVVPLERSPALTAVQNPFNQNAEIAFVLSRSEMASLSVYDASGNRVTQLASGVMAAGRHQYTWNAGSLPSGDYFCILRGSGGAVSALRITHTR